MSIEKAKRSLRCSFAWLRPGSGMALETHPGDFGTKKAFNPPSLLSPRVARPMSLFATRRVKLHTVFSHELAHARVDPVESRRLTYPHVITEITSFVEQSEFWKKRLSEPFTLKRIHHQMECAAVDGRGGAVHSHGALHAPVRTADSELRRPSQGKGTAVFAPFTREEKGSGDDARGEGPGGNAGSLKYIVAYLSREARFLRSRVERTDYGALMDRKCARELW
ncbi:hypothetical protein DBV15_00182 [Temnothorax longispinosus]|uniref:Uncharacterized protein n=1 Tax=Temnothorax longispinosus TaxID=300112 RepID=A0A4S2KIA5_9HYME|nr:hypothetical protein DBV15_00182 [Temnothorax longispinosus]